MDDAPIMDPVHPGVILAEEFLEPMGITSYQLAKDIGVPQTRISAITHGRRRISADTGLRLSRYFGMSEGFWTGLQDDYERELAKDRLGDALDAIRPIAS
ncbi:HigA family addiction module antitoxin [Tomitella fengzijianii]|uniref:HigA family addiction module antidote protein n=1 Tax=Tomitella fengzijianii TaxID=2597660 RepID=A0A516X0V8_9ACTN|nr:HigA family addiction module antitoxin [Tomitella fengzijianii]QDQ96712.1 HigA family addiction module antidote protein [Tomitella fengzijianii]